MIVNSFQYSLAHISYSPEVCTSKCRGRSSDFSRLSAFPLSVISLAVAMRMLRPWYVELQLGVQSRSYTGVPY